MLHFSDSSNLTLLRRLSSANRAIASHHRMWQQRGDLPNFMSSGTQSPDSFSRSRRNSSPELPTPVHGLTHAGESPSLKNKTSAPELMELQQQHSSEDTRNIPEKTKRFQSIFDGCFDYYHHLFYQSRQYKEYCKTHPDARQPGSHRQKALDEVARDKALDATLKKVRWPEWDFNCGE